MPAVNAVKAWAEAHIGEMEASRGAYDRNPVQVWLDSN
jgi:hypothetical protein